jgi:VIT1/CCC1 family predicted Fe2+/Mn2+ transporter
MNLVLDITLAIHLLAFATILGGVLSETKNFKTGAKVNSGILHGSWLALLTGLVMTGLIYAIGEENINNLVLSIKGLLLTGIFFIGYTYQKKDSAPKWVVPTIGALAIAAMSFAVIGHIVVSK